MKFNLQKLSRNLFLSIFGLAWFIASASGEEDLRVMSFNLRGDFDHGVAVESANGWNSLTGNHRRDRAIATIQEYAPDLLGVQEALPNQVEELRSALKEYGYYGIGRDDGKLAGEQCAIFFASDRFTLLKSGTFWLSPTPWLPSLHPNAKYARIASWVLLRDKDADDNELMVVNTHWEHDESGAAAREFSAVVLRDKVFDLVGNRALIVMGDFNAYETDRSMRILRQANGIDSVRLVDSFRQVHSVRMEDEKTYHGFEGGVEGRRIDYILHNRRLEPTEATIVRESEGRLYVSDHYPVTATLTFQD